MHCVTAQCSASVFAKPHFSATQALYAVHCVLSHHKVAGITIDAAATGSGHNPHRSPARPRCASAYVAFEQTIQELSFVSFLVAL